MRRECRERFPRHRFQRKPLVSDPGMHHGTCVSHVPWCISGSLTRCSGENVPGIPGAYATRNFTYLARCPLKYYEHFLNFLGHKCSHIVTVQLSWLRSRLDICIVMAWLHQCPSKRMPRTFIKCVLWAHEPIREMYPSSGFPDVSISALAIRFSSHSPTGSRPESWGHTWVFMISKATRHDIAL